MRLWPGGMRYRLVCSHATSPEVWAQRVPKQGSKPRCQHAVEGVYFKDRLKAWKHGRSRCCAPLMAHSISDPSQPRPHSSHDHHNLVHAPWTRPHPATTLQNPSTALPCPFPPLLPPWTTHTPPPPMPMALPTAHHGHVHAPSPPRPSHTNLGAQSPGGQHMAAVVEPLWLHLGVTGSTETGNTLKLRGTLEDLHVVHQRLVSLGD